MKYVFDTEAVIKATETIKRFCEHQERCKDCMFNRERRGTSDYCAILNDTPSEWNFRKKEESISKNLNTIMPGTGDITTKVQTSEVTTSTDISEERDIRDVVHDMVHAYFDK